MSEAPFWKTKTLAEMSEAEWESLCDGCGKCCLIRLEDADTGELYLTDRSCNLFDASACRCRDYSNRWATIPDCVKLTPDNIASLDWMPKTCAYRLVSEGKDLFDWHPLVCGDGEEVHRRGMSVRGQVSPEGKMSVRALMRRIRSWPGEGERENESEGEGEGEDARERPSKTGDGPGA